LLRIIKIDTLEEIVTDELLAKIDKEYLNFLYDSVISYTYL